MILADYEIAERAARGMITPFCADTNRDGVISYGLSSYGYDMRLGYEFKFLITTTDTTIDPKQPDESQWLHMRDVRHPVTLLPGQVVLGVSLETWDLPDDVFALVVGKSTYARPFIHVLTTPMEPGWQGKLVIEIANLSPRNVLIYPGEGIAQAVFFRGERPHIGYADRSGKYQYQTGVTLGRV